VKGLFRKTKGLTRRLNIAWQFPANCPNPEEFEILIFAAGTD